MKSNRIASFVRAGTFLTVLAYITLATPQLRAGSATWGVNADGDWNRIANWSPATVPNGPNDTATFSISNKTSVSFSDPNGTEVNAVVFNANASAFTITATNSFGLTISGAGITNNSATVQNFVANDDGGGSIAILFSGSASAGNLTHFTLNGGVDFGGGGTMEFRDTSTAANAVFVVNASAGSNAGSGGEVEFFANSTAASSHITVSGATTGNAAIVDFHNSATAGNAILTNNGGGANGFSGGSTLFNDSSTAGNATLIANGGTSGGRGGGIQFRGDSTGGTARVEVFGNGTLDISFHNSPGVTIGSLEGTGTAFLGAHNLTVGSNNLSTTFAGFVSDNGQSGGVGGSLTKIGTGTLSLTNSNTYTGGTLINVGTLVGGADGALGRGNVSLTASSVTLTLQNGATNNYIADSANLSLVNGSTINLNFSGNPDAISSLVIDGIAQAPGLYGSATSGAPFQRPEFFGSGELLVTAIPEPSTWMLTLGSATALLALRARAATRLRQAQAAVGRAKLFQTSMSVPASGPSHDE